jgi:hypothetical protein
MITGESYKARVRRWSRLRSKLKDAQMPVLGNAKLLLEQQLEKLQAAKQRQEAFTASRVQATRELNQLLAITRELVSRIQSYLKYALGRRDARLFNLGLPLTGEPSSEQTQPPGEAKETAPPATTPTAES